MVTLYEGALLPLPRRPHDAQCGCFQMNTHTKRMWQIQSARSRCCSSTEFTQSSILGEKLITFEVSIRVRAVIAVRDQCAKCVTPFRRQCRRATAVAVVVVVVVISPAGISSRKRWHPKSVFQRNNTLSWRTRSQGLGLGLVGVLGATQHSRWLCHKKNTYVCAVRGSVAHVRAFAVKYVQKCL